MKYEDFKGEVEVLRYLLLLNFILTGSRAVSCVRARTPNTWRECLPRASTPAGTSSSGKRQQSGKRNTRYLARPAIFVNNIYSKEMKQNLLLERGGGWTESLSISDELSSILMI